MQFISADTQRLFFETIYARRSKRCFMNIDAPDIHFEQLDRCLNIIMCHDPDIWSYGTGVLLSGPTRRMNRKHKHKKCLESKKRAYIMRTEALKEHNYQKEFRLLENESFGYFVRVTLEYRDRIRVFSYKALIFEEQIIPRTLQVIDYVEKNITIELEDFDDQASICRERALKIHGFDFDYYQSLTKYDEDYKIINQIAEYCMIDHLVRNPLRTALLEIFPNILDNELAKADFLKLLVKNTGECIVCYEEGEVLSLPCHSSHIMCEKCTLKVVFSTRSLCPMCRLNISFRK